MRTFIAIELPEEIKAALAALQERLRLSRADAKWVEPRNIHLTLKFLGERDDKKVARFCEILEDTAKNHPGFSCRITSLGAFPRLESPRVVWVGIDSGDEEIKAISGELEENIAKAGIPKEERPFSSHITIARVRSPLNREKLVQEIRNYADLGGKTLEFSISKITLFKSTLTPQGPVYEILKEASLKAT